MSLNHACSRCLAEPKQLHAMLSSPGSGAYSILLCDSCKNLWEERKPKILLAALDLFVRETPPKSC